MNICKEIEVADQIKQELAIEKMARKAVLEIAGEITYEHERLISEFAENIVQKVKDTELDAFEYAASCLSWNYPDKQKQEEWSVKLQVETLLR